VRRTFSAAAALVTLGALTTGCSLTEKDPVYEANLEVTGGAVEKISYSVLQRPADGDEKRVKMTQTVSPPPKLPWKTVALAWSGEVTLDVVPKSGAGSCRVVVEGKVIAEGKGAPGQPFTCRGTISK
jgi:hypothetical protein